MHTVFCRNIIDYGLVNIYKYWKQQKNIIILIFKIVDFVLQWYTASDNESKMHEHKFIPFNCSSIRTFQEWILVKH